MELRRKTTWESSLNKIKTETYKSHNLQPLACPTTGGNSLNKIKTETYKSHNLHPSFLPPTTTKYFPTHAVDLVIIDEAHHYSARTKKIKKVKPIIKVGEPTQNIIWISINTDCKNEQHSKNQKIWIKKLNKRKKIDKVVKFVLNQTVFCLNI